MNQQWIQDVHTRANKATLGPWCTVKEQSEIIGTCFKVRTAEDYPRSIASALVVGSDKALEQVETDFEFLAHARMDIPALLEVVEELSDKWIIKCCFCGCQIISEDSLEKVVLAWNQRFLDARIGKTQKLLSDALYTIRMGGVSDD